MNNRENRENFFVKTLFKSVNAEELTPEKEAAALTAIKAIKGLEAINQKTRQEEIAVYQKFKQANPDIKADLPEIICLDVKDESGNTPLIWASYHGHTAIVTKLIEEKAVLDAQNKYGNSALICASYNGHIALVTKLTEEKAALNVQNKDGDTALMFASTNGHIAIVTKLRDEKAALDIQNNNGDTALIMASNNGYTAIVTKLIEAGANLELTNNAGKTALDYAIQKNNLALVSLLLQHGAVIRNPAALQTFLSSQQRTTKVCFFYGSLLEQEGNYQEAKSFYQAALLATVPYPPVYRRMGEIYEQERNLLKAVEFYRKALAEEDSLSPKRLVNVAQKLLGISIEMKKENAASGVPTAAAGPLPKRGNQNKIEENEIATVTFLEVTADIYEHFLSNGLYADLPLEQWIFLAMDAMGNPYFQPSANYPNRDPMQGMHFALRAAQKAEEKTKTEKEKDEVQLVTLNLWKMFQKAINVLQSDMIDAKSDHSQQLEALKEAAAQESLNIIAAFVGDKAVKDHLEIFNLPKIPAALKLASADSPITHARKLILAGANLELTSKRGNTALDSAIRRKNLALVELLLQHGARIRNPAILERFLNSQEANEQVHFCLGVLSEQKGSYQKAKNFYQTVKTKAYPPALRRLGKMCEKEGNLSRAVTLYSQALKGKEILSLQEMVTVAQKLSTLPTGMKKENVSLQALTESKFPDVNYSTLTASIYAHLISTGFYAYLPTEQWMFLAADAMVNSYFRPSNTHRNRHAMQGIHFALRTARKAEEQAKSEEEKREAHITALTVWGMFRQATNPLHCHVLDANSTHQQQLDALKKAAVEESLGIIVEYADDKAVKKEVRRVIF